MMVDNKKEIFPPQIMTGLHLVLVLSILLHLLVPVVAWGKSPAQDALDLGVYLYREGKFKEALLAVQESMRLEHSIKGLEWLGSIYLKLNDYDAAIEAWDTVLKIEPENITMINDIATIHLEMGFPEKAKLKFHESLEILPRQPYLLFRLAQIEEKIGETKNASTHYKAAEDAYRLRLKNNPNNSHDLVHLGWTLLRQEKLQEALQQWEKAVAIDSDQTSLFKHMADAYLELELLSKAKLWYENALQHDSKSPEIFYHLAEIALWQNRGEEAALWLERLFNLPEWEEAWPMKVANLFLRENNVEQGLDFFKKSTVNFSGKASVRAALGHIYRFQSGKAYQEKRWLAAIAGYNKTLELDPTSTRTLRDMGWAYWQAGQLDLCEQTWNRYRTAYPNHPEPYNLLTQIYLFKSSFKAAIDSSEDSLRLDPNQPGERLKRAKALFWDKQYEKARTAMETLSRQYPDNLSIQFFWGELLMEYHDYKRGVVQWRKVLEIDSTSERAQRYRLLSLYSLGRYEEAIEEADRILENEGPKHRILKFLADDALVLDDKETAIRFYKKLTRQFPDQPSFFLTLSLLYHVIQKETLAHESLIHAVQIHPDNLEILLALADSKGAMNQHQDAYDAYSNLLKRYPFNYRAYQGTIFSLIELGRFQEALVLLEQNQSTFLKDYELAMLRGRIHAGMGKLEEAKAFFLHVASPKRSKRNALYVPILMYHGLGDHPRSPNLPIEKFSSQLKALRNHGYTTITVSQLKALLSGQSPWPEKPILITFDDARIDAFERGDPILAQYGMVATMFVPTGRIHPDGPFFANWEMLRHYQKTGRWDMQGHGHYSHDPLPTGPDGETGSFLVNKRWLEQEGRQETYAEFIRRLRQDYQEGIHQLEKNDHRVNVVGYAFPFSEVGQQNAGNEGNAVAVNEKLVFDYYQYAFIQDQSGYNKFSHLETTPRMLRRFGVPASWDGTQLIQHLIGQHPSHLAQIQFGKSLYWEEEYQQSRQVFERLALTEKSLRNVSEYHLAHISYNQELYREAEKHLHRSLKQQIQPSHESRILMDKIQWENRLSIGNQFNFVHDTNNRDNFKGLLYLRYPFRQPVEILASVGVVQLRENKLDDLSGKEISMGGSWKPSDPVSMEIKFRYRKMDRIEDTQNLSLHGEYQRNRHAFQLQWAYEDVETLRAYKMNLHSQRYNASYRVLFTPEWRGRTGLAYQDYEDENKRINYWARITHTLNAWPGWQLGGTFDYTNTKFDSDAYYTPEDLYTGRGIIFYHHTFDAGLTVGGELGFGLDQDKFQKTMGSNHQKLRLIHAWNPKIKTDLGIDFSNATRYQSKSFDASLHWLF